MRALDYADLIKQWGTPADAARALDLDRRTVDGWKRRRIPSRHQLKAAHVSNGALVPDAEAIKYGAEIASYLQKKAA